MHDQPRAESCLGSPGVPQKVTVLERTWTSCEVLLTLATMRLSSSGSTAVSITTGSPATMKPNRAGSPSAGGRLKTGTATRRRPRTPVIATDAAPTAAASGHSLMSSSLIWKYTSSSHCGRVLAFPTRPAGSGKRRLRGWAGCSTPLFLTAIGPELNWTVVVSWKGCEPACQLGSPPSSSAWAAKLSIPNGARSGLIRTAWEADALAAFPPDTVTDPGAPATGGCPVSLTKTSTSSASKEVSVPLKVQETSSGASTAQGKGPDLFCTPAKPSTAVASTPAGNSSTIVTGLSEPSTGASPKLVAMRTRRPLPPE